MGFCWKASMSELKRANHGGYRLLSGGRTIFSWATGGKPRVPSPLPNAMLKPEITTLKNGLRIVSQESERPNASVGIIINTGTVHEKAYQLGMTRLLERVAFVATSNRTNMDYVRDMTNIGGQKACRGSREHLAYTIDSNRVHLPRMMELLVDAVQNPIFFELNVKEKILELKAEVYGAHPRFVLLDALHSAGYRGGLANPLMANPALDRINAASLMHYVAQHFTAPRMVLAASGVDHKELVNYAENLMSDLPCVSLEESAASVYVGGDTRLSSDSRPTYIALAFELPGGWKNLKHALILLVLQMLMGGGQSLSAGDAEWMYLRPYVRVLNKYPAIESFTAFSSIYNDTGLFGIMVSADSVSVPQAIDVAIKELICVAKPSGIVRKQLKVAKDATKCAILKNLESRDVEYMATQVLMYGERKPVDQILEIVEEITSQDISDVVGELISSPLTMASYGNVVHQPAYESVSRRFHPE